MNQISLSPFANFNSAVPWGLWVSIYIWLVGISAGSFLLVMWGNFKNNISLKKITRLAMMLSLSTLSAGLVSILIDLGHIERFYKLFISPNPNSVMACVVWLYNVYFVILAMFILRLKKQIPKPLALFSVIFALGIIIAESLLFTMPPGKHWHSLIFPIHFLTSSLVSAAASLIFIVGVSWPKGGKEELLKGLSKFVLPLVFINLIVEIIDMVSHGGLIYAGNWFLILINILVIVLLFTQSALTITFAGGIGALAVLFSKYSNLISAQLVEPFKGFSKAYIEPRLQFSYAPTSFEYLASIFLIALTVILFYILYKILPLTREE
jgi:molybdopterin-containing oxidoreductase family membrane subunit